MCSEYILKSEGDYMDSCRKNSLGFLRVSSSYLKQFSVSTFAKTLACAAPIWSRASSYAQYYIKYCLTVFIFRMPVISDILILQFSVSIFTIFLLFRVSSLPQDVRSVLLLLCLSVLLNIDHLTVEYDGESDFFIFEEETLLSERVLLLCVFPNIPFARKY